MPTAGTRSLHLSTIGRTASQLLGFLALTACAPSPDVEHGRVEDPLRHVVVGVLMTSFTRYLYFLPGSTEKS